MGVTYPFREELPYERQPALRHHSRQGKPGAGEHAQGFLEHGLQVRQLEGLFHGDGTLRLPLGHESIQLRAKLGEHGPMPIKVINHRAQRNPRRLRPRNHITQDMIVDTALVEGLRILPMSRIQRRQVILLEDTRFFGFGDGVLVEDVGGVERGGGVFGHGGGGELVDVGEADVAFGGDELHEAEDGGVPLGEDAHDGAVAGVGVDGGHDVGEVGAFVEEAEGFAEL